MDAFKISNIIKKLKKIKLQKYTTKQIEELITPLFVGLRMVTQKFNSGINLFRGRICNKPENISEISYPPSNLVKSFGRCNYIGQSMLYTAIGRNIPFFELYSKKGDKLVIAQYRTNKELLLNHIGYSEESFNLLKSKRNYNAYKYVRLTQQLGSINQKIYDFLAKKFTENIKHYESYKYKLTAVISNKMLMGNLFNGLIYPTIALSGNADNIALKPDAADNFLKLTRIEYILIEEVKDLEYKIKILDTATKWTESGNILWSGRNKFTWTLYHNGDKLEMIAKDGVWCAFDKNGNEVDPD